MRQTRVLLDTSCSRRLRFDIATRLLPAPGPECRSGCWRFPYARLELCSTLLALAAFASISLPGCCPRPVPNAAVVASAPAAPAQRVTVEEVRDSSGKVYQIQQGLAGDPATVGCSDGQREAFVDQDAFPTIAGCIATWEGTRSLRDPATGGACGDDAGPCAAPANACATGWHICGASGALKELRQVTGDQCEQAGGGRFSAAVSHCKSQSGCEADRSPEASYACYPSGWCSEAVCCGSDCGGFGACRDGIWPGKTHIAVGVDQGCAAVNSHRAGGLLCCRNYGP